MFSILIFILNFLTLTFINITVGVTDSEEFLPLVIILIMIQTVALFFDSYVSEGVLKKFRLQIFLGYILRLGLMFFDIYGREIYMLPGSGADNDIFYWNARTYALNDIAERGGSFSETMGIIFKCVGINKVFASFMIVLCSIVILWLFAKTLELLEVPDDKSSIIMFILCLMPNFAIMSSIFLREIPIALFTSISVYLFLYWMRKGNVIVLFISFASLMAGSYFHAGVSVIIGGYILIIFLYNPEEKKFIFTPYGLAVAIVFTLVFLFLFANYGDTFFQKFTKIESTEDISDNAERGSSSYAKYVGSSKTPLKMIIYTIPRMFYFLFSPLPWQWRGPKDMFSFMFSSMFYAIALFFALRTIIMYHGEKRYIAITLIILATCAVFVFGWGVNNTGTAIRHRDKLILIFAAMIMIYFSDFRKKRRHKFVPKN